VHIARRADAGLDFPGQAIRVRANYSYGELVTRKSGKVRSVPMVPDVAKALARLGQRKFFTGDEDPVFAGAARATAARWQTPPSPAGCRRAVLARRCGHPLSRDANLARLNERPAKRGVSER
jgi:hypothetical protein